MKIGERFDRWCYAALFAVVLAAIALHLLILADTTFLWTDELFSWSVAVPTSWSGLWQAMYRGSDGMFPAFYVLSWCWSHLFGQSELGLRLPGILFTLAGGVAAYLLIRKLWGDAAACVSLGLLLLGNEVLLNHAGQFRGYGMLLGLTSLGLYWLVPLSHAHPHRRRLLWANAVTQLLLCLTHPFGVLYGAALGGGKVLANARREKRRWDWGLVGSYLPAALGLIAWAPGIRAVSQLNVPRGWQTPVTGEDLGKALVPPLENVFSWAALFVGLAILVVAGALARRPATDAETPSDAQSTAVILAVAILAVGPLAWVVSWITDPLFLPRYLLPATWGWAILGAALWSALARSVSRAAQLAAAVLVVALAGLGLSALYFPRLIDRTADALPTLRRLRVERQFATGMIDLLFLKERLPVFMESIHSFLPRDHYNPGKYDYRLVLNRQLAWDGRDVKGASIERNLALKLCENGLEPRKIVDTSELPAIAARLDAFYFLDLKDRPTADDWLAGLAREGWRQEMVCPKMGNPHAGNGVIWKFSRPRDAAKIPPR